MKRIKNLLQNWAINMKLVNITLILVCGFQTGVALGQSSVSGKLCDEKTNQALPFANVALLRVTDSSMVNGSISDFDGQFIIKPVSVGSYQLKISVMGYQSVSNVIEISESRNYDLGILMLQEILIELGETEVIAERMKAKTELDKTTYFITSQLVEASKTGTDIVKMVPGIQVDLMDNISLEGSRNILILVNGKERDQKFLNQMNPEQIEKIEVMNSPAPKYDANVNGVINVVLKKDQNQGFGGHLYAEIPTSSKIIYAKPTYGFNYGIGKLELSTSYNGDASYFNISESNQRTFTRNNQTTTIDTKKVIKQKNWSHRFHFGLDYSINDRNQINFYSFFNPYSWEHDGIVEMHYTGADSLQWKVNKNDNDLNNSAFYSVFFKHLFNNEGSEVTFEISRYVLKGENSTTYSPFESDEMSVAITNCLKPRQNDLIFKLDFNSSPGKKIQFSAGAKAKLQTLQDEGSVGFHYTENLVAAYNALYYKNSNVDVALGVRMENSNINFKDNFNYSILSFLPFASLGAKLSPDQNLKLSFGRTVNRPKIFQLNPARSFNDPYSVSCGNPALKPVFTDNFFIEYSNRFNNNLITTRLFHEKHTNVINQFTFVNDTATFETGFDNVGTVQQIGIQCTGALKIGKMITFNPYLRVFNQNTAGNKPIEKYSIKNRHQIVVESSFSALISFKHDFDVSLLFQYASPKNSVLDNWRCDALYFISIGKTFRKNIKAGLMCALPLKNSFTYSETEIEGSDFYEHNEEVINLPMISTWFTLSYNFGSGQKQEKTNFAKEEFENLPKKGF